MPFEAEELPMSNQILQIAKKTIMTERQGITPLRSSRKPDIASLPDVFPSGVTIIKSNYALTFVESINNIEDGPIVGREIVDCWVLDNGILKVKAILMGGNVVSIEKGGQEYLWQNREGATYYGRGSDAFPLNRGLILHGGIRVAAVTAEHGLYYDTDWDIDFIADPTGSAIILKIKDTQENRNLLCDILSKGQFLSPGSNVPMSKYPVTDAEFIFTVSLRPGEAFVRLNAALINTKETPVTAEIWLPQTYPVTKNSQIISYQKKRRCKDLWVYMGMLKDNFVVQDMQLDKDNDLPAYQGKNGFIVGCPPNPASWTNADLNKPLDWPSGWGGILYDYPRRDGYYHAVSYGDGRGTAYVSISNDKTPHYTKMWSWGNPDIFNRQEALAQNPPLAAGRPKSEYYEPWGSGFNTCFFQPSEFPQGESSWDAFIVPIESGLDSGKTQQELRDVIDQKIEHITPKLT